MNFTTTALANHNVGHTLWNIYLRKISTEEMNDLHWMLDNDQESGYRAKMILLRNEGYTVPEIRKITNHHDNNIRKWIHRFNEKGIDGIVSRKHIRNAHKITEDIERKIVEIASNDPRRKYRLKFSTWSLRVLAGYIIEEKKLVESISHTEIKNVLVKHGIEWRNSKMVLGKSRDPAEYELKKIGLKN
ncbi:MAG TPA: helix-turn-helix domain-containing protein [Nitrososphaeraceae archaeon]|nr:helix-turn-helix domain-containing protein [Nitrososphaeraceae archaeon]